jgi:hypothetical protein
MSTTQSVEAAFSGAGTLTGLLSCTKIGSIVMLAFPYTTTLTVTSELYTCSNIIPNDYCPKSTIYFPVMVTDQSHIGSSGFGILTISPEGSLTIGNGYIYQSFTSRDETFSGFGFNVSYDSNV